MSLYLSTKIIPLGSTAFRQHRSTSHCQYLHGYRLQAKFWITAKTLDQNGWIYDFGNFKDLKSALEHMFDHTTCIAADDPQKLLFETLHERKVIDLRIFEDGVGIEKFAKFVFEAADEYVKETTENRCWVTKVEIWEHESNSAIYQLDPIINTNISDPIAAKDIAIDSALVEMTKTAEENPDPKRVEVVGDLSNPANKSIEIKREPVLNNQKTTNTYKDLFAGTSWGGLGKSVKR